jgi:haloacetate dehalogenase
MWDDFKSEEITTQDAKIFTYRGGSGQPVLLLHGFPQSHLMWKGIAPILARHFTVVCADLRGYGRSSCPASTPDHFPYSKRAMAIDMVAVMDKLGFPVFALVGHDRGARVAYRLALDSPDRVSKVAVLDIVPTSVNWQRADANFVRYMWPWSLLAQPAPLPESILAAAPDAIVDAFRVRDSAAFDPKLREIYIETLGDPDHAHAICEDYRAGATLDRLYDEEDQASGRKIECPVLALWAGRGGQTGKAHNDIGGPLSVWKLWARDVKGRPMNGGHFFPEEIPEETAATLTQFFSGDDVQVQRGA